MSISYSIAGNGDMSSCQLFVTSQIANTIEKISIGHWSDTKVSDRCIIDVVPMVFVTCICVVDVAMIIAGDAGDAKVGIMTTLSFQKYNTWFRSVLLCCFHIIKPQYLCRLFIQFPQGSITRSVKYTRRILSTGSKPRYNAKKIKSCT